MFIEYPHGFCCINRGTAADSNNDVRLEFLHSLSPFPHFLNGWVRINAFHGMGLDTCIVKDFFYFLKETAAPHGMAACTDKCFLVAFQDSELFNSSITDINISWKRKTEHENLLLYDNTWSGLLYFGRFLIFLLHL